MLFAKMCYDFKYKVYYFFQQWGQGYNATQNFDPNANVDDQDGRRYTNENRFVITNQRGNSSNCTPKCFAEKGSRVSLYEYLNFNKLLNNIYFCISYY